jgi:protoporphyrinogen oxidase
MRDPLLDRVENTFDSSSVLRPVEGVPRLCIVGGGPAGLAVGFYARRKAIPFVLLEAEDSVGGNARTLRHGEFLFDTGAHRFHDKNEQVTRDVRTLLGDDLLLTEKPSQIVYGKQRIDFPLSPLNLVTKLGPAMTVKSGLDFLRESFRTLPPEANFADLTVHRYGRTLAQAFLLDYSAKLWGAPSDRLSPAVSGQRLKGLDLRTFFVEAVRGSRAKTRHLDGCFYYPSRGIGMLMESLADACGPATVRTRSRVTQLIHDGRRVWSVEVNGRERISAEQVVSTLPLSVLTSVMSPPPPEAVLSEARRLRFRHLMLVVLFLNRERVSDNASLYFPEPHVPFTRVYEPKNRSEAMAPADQTSLAVEIPCSPGDPAWQSASEPLAQAVISVLEEKRLIRAGDVFDAAAYCIPYAYPILEIGYAAAVRNLMDYFAPFENLRIVGRSAAFAYVHLHDLLREGRNIVAELAPVTVP